MRALVALIHANHSEADRAEVLTVAFADPESALISFRERAAQQGLFEVRAPVETADDRRTCRQCANLERDGRCHAAARGELSYVASPRYEPAPDVPKRCEGFEPLPGDPDPRPGHERWPELLADGERLRGGTDYVR